MDRARCTVHLYIKGPSLRKPIIVIAHNMKWAIHYIRQRDKHNFWKVKGTEKALYYVC